MTPVGGIVKLGTPSSYTCVEMVLLYTEVVINITINFRWTRILSRLCDSMLWVIKYTENSLDTNIPILIND